MGNDLVCEHCWFVGHGGYATYSNGANDVFIRPRFGRLHPWGSSTRHRITGSHPPRSTRAVLDGTQI